MVTCNRLLAVTVHAMRRRRLHPRPCLGTQCYSRRSLPLLRYLWLFVVLCFPLNAFSASAARMLDELVTPEGVTLELVVGNMVVNGKSVAVATLESTTSVESIIQFYRERWTAQERWALPGNGDKPAFIESSVPGWKLISRLVNGYNVVVQLSSQDENSAKGLVSIARLENRVTAVEHGVFGNLDMLSSNVSTDGVDVSSMRVYGSNSSASRTRDRYRALLLRKGWHLVADTSVADGLVTQLGRDNARLELTFIDSEDFASLVVVHEVTSD